MNLLLVEDEPKLAASLGEALGNAGWAVTVCENGLDGLRAALASRFSVIVLDRTLPGLDGIAFLNALRTQKRTPVLMLSALGAVDERVSGLQAGADDYLAKPFSFSELNARLESLVRRGGDAPDAPPDPESLTLADLELQLAARKVTRAGRRIALSAREFQLLELLMRRKGRALSRQEIAEQIWDMNFDGDMNVIEVAIRRLRSKIDDPFDARLLHTVRGLGYILEERHS